MNYSDVLAAYYLIFFIWWSYRGVWLAFKLIIHSVTKCTDAAFILIVVLDQETIFNGSSRLSNTLCRFTYQITALANSTLTLLSLYQTLASYRISSWYTSLLVRWENVSLRTRTTVLTSIVAATILHFLFLGYGYAFFPIKEHILTTL